MFIERGRAVGPEQLRGLREAAYPLLSIGSITQRAQLLSNNPTVELPNASYHSQSHTLGELASLEPVFPPRQVCLTLRKTRLNHGLRAWYDRGRS